MIITFKDNEGDDWYMVVDHTTFGTTQDGEYNLFNGYKLIGVFDIKETAEIINDDLY